MGKRTKNDKIILGSGKSYIAEFDVAKGLPTTAEICKPENELGKTKGGAALLYSTEEHKETDDLGTVAKTVIIAEEASLKLGMITFNGNTLAKLIDRCKVDEKDGFRTVKIGGAGNAQGKDWVVCFFHEDKKDGNIWVLVRGSNKAGLELTFATDGGSKIEPEFTALPQDDAGTLITYIEEIDAAQNAE
jgi:hypothetical protein